MAAGNGNVAASQLKNALKERLQATHVEVTDDSDGCGGKFTAIIVSDQFEGKPFLARHRLVHSAIEEELKHIHAFSQSTYTVKQWEELKSSKSN